MHGVCTTCMGMCSNGVGIGLKRSCRAASIPICILRRLPHWFSRPAVQPEYAGVGAGRMMAGRVGQRAGYDSSPSDAPTILGSELCSSNWGHKTERKRALEVGSARPQGNQEGCQTVAGGRWAAATPGQGREKSGTPERGANGVWTFFARVFPSRRRSPRPIAERCPEGSRAASAHGTDNA